MQIWGNGPKATESWRVIYKVSNRCGFSLGCSAGLLSVKSLTSLPCLNKISLRNTSLFLKYV